jgi:hypothetical protein
LHDLLHRLALGDRRQRDREPLPSQDDVRGGIGVEVTGAALGLPTVDLLGVAEVLAVIGDQGQVDRQPLAPPAQRSGQTTGQGAVELPLKFGELGHRGDEGFADRLLGGELVESPARGVDRGDPGGGDQEDGPEGRGRDLPLVGAERDVLLKETGGGLMDLLAVQRTMVWAHGSLRAWLRVQKP